MSNAWVNSGNQVTIITLDDGCNQPFFDLNPDIRMIGLNVFGTSSGCLDVLIRNLTITPQYDALTISARTSAYASIA